MMCRWWLGLLILLTTVASHATELENSVFFRHPDLLTLQLAHFDFDRLLRTPPYRLSLSLVPVYSAVNVRYGAESTHPSRLAPAAERPSDWATSDNWSHFVDRGHSSSVPVLRLESKGQRLELKPRRHSLSIQWSKTLP